MTLPTAVLFDNDGLLLDTESVWTRAEQQMFAARGLELTLADKRELVGMPAQTAGEILARQLGEPGHAVALIAELDELVFAELERGVEAMVGAPALVEELRRRRVPIGLVSNSPTAFILRALELVGMSGRFDAVVSGHEVAAPKPAPDPYLAACERLRVAPGPQVVVLEDSPIGVAAGRAAGLTVIGVPSLPGLTLDDADELFESLAAAELLARLGLAT